MSLLGEMMLRQGTWYLESKKDERWNCCGRGEVGGLVMPTDVEKKIKPLRNCSQIRDGYRKEAALECWLPAWGIPIRLSTLPWANRRGCGSNPPIVQFK